MLYIIYNTFSANFQPFGVKKVGFYEKKAPALGADVLLWLMRFAGNVLFKITLY